MKGLFGGRKWIDVKSCPTTERTQEAQEENLLFLQIAQLKLRLSTNVCWSKLKSINFPKA